MLIPTLVLHVIVVSTVTLALVPFGWSVQHLYLTWWLNAGQVSVDACDDGICGLHPEHFLTLLRPVLLTVLLQICRATVPALPQLCLAIAKIMLFDDTVRPS